MTTTLRVLIVVVALVVAVTALPTNGFPVYALPNPEVTSCDIDGHAVPVGSSRITSGCSRCSCSKEGIGCCGVGVKAMKVANPEAYNIVNRDGCDYYELKE